jgi:hypothetical protein
MPTITTSGTWTSVNATIPNVKGINTNHLRWGRPLRPHNKQCGYNFEGVTAMPVLLDGTEFKLGTFTHHNFTIAAAATLRFSINLKLTLIFNQGEPTREFNFIFEQ